MDRMNKWFVCDDGMVTQFATKAAAKAYAEKCLASYREQFETDGAWHPAAAWLYWGRVEQDTVETETGFELRDVR
jgi:hypothetical protein